MDGRKIGRKMGGWFKVYRSLLKKTIWQNSTASQKAVLMTILLLTSNEPKQWDVNGHKVEVPPGSIFTTLRGLASASGCNIGAVRKALSRFKFLEFIDYRTYSGTHGGYLISIVNWGFYQSNDKAQNTMENTFGTHSEHIQNTCRTDNKEEIENIRNKEYRESIERNRFQPPSVDDVKQYALSCGLFINAESFIDYYKSNGWRVGKAPMKDWKAAVRNWCRREKKYSSPADSPDNDWKSDFNDPRNQRWD